MEHVLITGASSGIGYELAKIYAINQTPLVITSSNQERIDQVREQLKQYSRQPIHAIAQDLSRKGAAKLLYQKIKDQQIPISTLINNAGFGCIGEFVETDFDTEEDMMMVNVVNLVGLTKLCLREMRTMGHGRILNVASTGAFQPGPYIASYYATKSFVLNFSEAIRMENKAYHIIISTLCPGATKTNFTERAGKNQIRQAMEASQVANVAYHQFQKGKKIIIPGWMNRLGQIPPKAIRSRFIGRLQKSLKR